MVCTALSCMDGSTDGSSRSLALYRRTPLAPTPQQYNCIEAFETLSVLEGESNLLPLYNTLLRYVRTSVLLVVLIYACTLRLVRRVVSGGPKTRMANKAHEGFQEKIALRCMDSNSSGSRDCRETAAAVRTAVLIVRTAYIQMADVWSVTTVFRRQREGTRATAVS